MYQVVDDYLNEMKRICDVLDRGAMTNILDMVKAAYDNNKTIFIAGNGGSAGTANHFSCDFSKNAVPKGGRKAKVVSLSCNLEYITAIGNDIAFEDIFSAQLENLMQEGDLLILISASGNSPDIVRACEFAKSKRAAVIGLAGFGGGRLAELADLPITVPNNTYEQVEDAHSMILHIIVCYFKSLRL